MNKYFYIISFNYILYLYSIKFSLYTEYHNGLSTFKTAGLKIE